NNCDTRLDALDPYCPAACADDDDDGYRSMVCGGADCDDANPYVNRGGVERCDNGVDDDCDGLSDGADALECPAGCGDADGDGYEDAACGGSDCDDHSFAVQPAAGEDCTDGRDNNCDGDADQDDA